MIDIITIVLTSAIYLFLGVLSGIFFRINGNLEPYANFKSTIIALLWPLIWVLSFAMAFWEWVSEK